MARVRVKGLGLPEIGITVGIDRALGVPAWVCIG